MRASTEHDRARSVVAAIADLARVVEPRRAEFYQLIVDEPLINVVAHGARWAKDQRCQAGSAFRKNNGTLSRAARAMRTVSDALFRLDTEERARVDLALRAVGLATDKAIADERGIGTFANFLAKDSQECEYIAHRLAEAFEWAIGIPRRPRHSTKAGRPKGTKGHPHFHHVVERLLEAANECDGRLPFDKKAGPNSPLVRAIYLLRPLLPAGFLPNIPPLATIERIVRDSRKNKSRRGGF
jgi:hypothetical protein